MVTRASKSLNPFRRVVGHRLWLQQQKQQHTAASDLSESILQQLQQHHAALRAKCEVNAAFAMELAMDVT